MRKILTIILISAFSLLAVVPASAQTEPINLYFFYGDGCPHCAKEEIFLDRIERERENVRVHRFEVWHNQNNAKLLSKVAAELKLDVRGVPVLIIGEEAVAGYFNDETTGKRIEGIIDRYESIGCRDAVAPILGTETAGAECVHGCDDGDAECLHDCGCSVDTEGNTGALPDTIDLPLLGTVNVKNYSLPVLTIVMGAIDGFNPCAMWVLLFLISLLIGMENRRRMWVLGTAFIVSSAAVYFLFLAAWLNFFLFLGLVAWIRLAIAIVAVGSGGYHIYNFYKHRDGGCAVTDEDKRKKMFTKMRAVISEKKFILALLGIVTLAAAVNLIELLCSAGLPAVYTQVLALSGLSAWQYYGYLLLYILIFMLDDLLIFLIAMLTLKMKAIGGRYTRYAGAIGGVIMIIIGFLLIFKPGWLMFG